MKINSTSSNPLLGGVSGTTRGESASHASTAAVAAGRSDVDLSPAARHLASTASWTQVADLTGVSKQAVWSRWRV